MDYCSPAHARLSTSSLYDVLASLDESQLQYLLQDLNHTTSQNMAVSQAVSAWSTTDPTMSLSYARSNLEKPKMDRSLSRSQRLSLSIQTIFRPSARRAARASTMSRSPAYKRISRPVFNLPADVSVADLQELLRAEFLNVQTISEYPSPTASSYASTSPSLSSTTRRLKSYPSTIDMALEREASAGGMEAIGIGMFEPRPCTPITPKSSRAPVYVATGESPPVLDGIFEVIGHR